MPISLRRAWLVAPLHTMRDTGSERRRLAARFGIAVLFVIWIYPLATFCFDRPVESA